MYDLSINKIPETEVTFFRATNHIRIVVCQTRLDAVILVLVPGVVTEQLAGLFVKQADRVV